jgi:hypothetical protein
MTLRDLNAQTRRRLRRHAWLLTLWCVAVGLATSLLLLHVFGVRLPAARYGIVAIVMYSLGLVVGARVWLVHFSRSVQSEPTLGVPATPDEIAEFENERAATKQPAERPSGGFQWLDLLGGVGDFVSFDEASALLIVPAIIVAIVGALLLTGVIPALVMDGVTGLLAEVAVQFVFGALIARRVIGPGSHDAAFMTIVGRTWLAGLVFVVVSLAAGSVLQRLNPGGATIADLFR